MPLLATGYWPSYNIPFHQKIYMMSGYGEMWKEYGEDFSYDLCPRAKIFRRDQADVKDLNSLKHIMRFNGVWLCLVVTSHKTLIRRHYLHISYVFHVLILTMKVALNSSQKNSNI